MQATVQPSPARTKLPLAIEGVFVATLVPVQPNAERKTYACSTPWLPPFQLGASLAFNQISDGIPSIAWRLSSDPAAFNRPTKLSCSLPVGFAANKVALGGLQLAAYAKKKPVPTPSPARQEMEPRPVSPPAAKKSKAAITDIAPDAPFIPPEGMKVLPTPARVDMATVKGQAPRSPLQQGILGRGVGNRWQSAALCSWLLRGEI